MVELVIRLLLLAGAVGIGAVSPGSDMDAGMKIGAALAAVAVFSYLLERRNLRTPDTATVLSIIDVAGVALWLASNGELSRYGFAVLGPVIWAVGRQRVQATSIVPIAGALLIAANSVAGRLPLFAPALLGQAGLVLAIGLILAFAPPASIIRYQPDTEVERVQPLTAAGDDYLQIRESYRNLKERFRDLERRSDKDKLVMRLFELRGRSDASVYPRLAETLADLVGSDGAAIYGIAQSESSLTIRGSTTDFPSELAERMFPIDGVGGEREIKARIDVAVRAIPNAERRDFANVLLYDHDERIIGMLCVAQSDVESLRICREKAEEAAPYVAAFLAEETARQTMEHRLKHAELLYEIATLSAGSMDATTLAQRVVGELAATLNTDGLAIHGVSHGDSEILAFEGANLQLADALHFITGTGVAAWVRAGHPEITLFDARNSDVCSPDAALKRRIGSYCQVPLFGRSGLLGYISAATHNAGGIDAFQVETLRVVAAELSRALSTLTSGSAVEGLMSGDEFRRLVQERSGCLVVLEVLHLEHLALSCGRPVLDGALRKLQTKLRAKLPPGGALCRRQEGNYLAFLESAEEFFATSWANDATVTASLIGVPKIDGSGATPLAVRAKVARIVPNEVSEFSRLSA
jgi:hypothetical protein